MTDTATTNTTATLSTEELVDTWLAAYADPDADRRRATIERIWHADGWMADPPFEGAGRDGIHGLTDVVLAHFPGHTFHRTTGVDLHHGIGRYGWELVGPDGTVAVAGMDLFQVGDDGLLKRVVGFFGDLPAKA